MRRRMLIAALSAVAVFGTAPAATKILRWSSQGEILT